MLLLSLGERDLEGFAVGGVFAGSSLGVIMLQFSVFTEEVEVLMLSSEGTYVSAANEKDGTYSALLSS